jgi:hypothetical protein
MGETTTIGYAHPGTVAGGFMDSVARTLLVDALRPEGRRFDVAGSAYTYCVSGPRIAKARNDIVRSFLKNGAEWLWMLDSDMTFAADCLDALFAVADANERPVVGGLCFGGGKGMMFPTMYQIVDPGENDGVPVRHVLDWPDHAVVPVDATGAACLLIHRGILETMLEKNPDSPTPWFHESIYKGQEFGEDWTFCLKVRMMDLPIYVATDAKTGHVKTFEMDEEMWRTGRVKLKFLDGSPIGDPALLDPSPKEPAIEVPKLEVVQNRQSRRHPERFAPVG